jgi:hypothetical protein
MNIGDANSCGFKSLKSLCRCSASYQEFKILDDPTPVPKGPMFMCILGSGVTGGIPRSKCKGFYECLWNLSLSPQAISYFKSQAGGIDGG